MKIDIAIEERRHVLGQLSDVGRCPHCSIAKPLFVKLWSTSIEVGVGGLQDNYWGSYYCTSCSNVITVSVGRTASALKIKACYPEAKTAHEDIPEAARIYLQQAYETLHAPDAAAVMAGSAVDAMLKAKGYIDGPLYGRIQKAFEENIITGGMASWAHNVRLGSNRPRHADAENPHVSVKEAKQSVEFAEALGYFLFVLDERVKRGIQASS